MEGSTCQPLPAFERCVYGSVYALAVSPRQTRIALGCGNDHCVRVYDAATGRLLHTLRGHFAPVFSVVFVPSIRGSCTDEAAGDGDDDDEQDDERHLRICAGGDLLDPTLRLWTDVSPQAGDELVWRQTWHAKQHSNSVRALTVIRLPVGHDDMLDMIGSGAADCTVVLWEASRGVPLLKLVNAGGVYDLAVSPTAPCLASVTEDGHVSLWDVQRLLAERRRHIELYGRPQDTLHTLGSSECERGTFVDGAQAGLVFSPDGSVLLVGTTNGCVVLCSVQSGAALRRLRAHSRNVSRLRFSGNGLLISSSWDATVRVWELDLELRRLFVVASLDGKNAGWVRGAEALGNGCLLTYSVDASVRPWDPGPSVRRSLVNAPVCARSERLAARRAVTALQELSAVLRTSAADGTPLPLMVLDCFVWEDAKVVWLKHSKKNEGH